MPNTPSFCSVPARCYKQGLNPSCSSLYGEPGLHASTARTRKNDPRAALPRGTNSKVGASCLPCSLGKDAQGGLQLEQLRIAETHLWARLYFQNMPQAFSPCSLSQTSPYFPTSCAGNLTSGSPPR